MTHTSNKTSSKEEICHCTSKIQEIRFKIRVAEISIKSIPKEGITKRTRDSSMITTRDIVIIKDLNISSNMSMRAREIKKRTTIIIIVTTYNITKKTKSRERTIMGTLHFHTIQTKSITMMITPTTEAATIISRHNLAMRISTITTVRKGSIVISISHRLPIKMSI